MFKFNQHTNVTYKTIRCRFTQRLNANLTVKPAPENFGIKFCRVDIDGDNLIDANFKNVVEPILCLKLKI